MRRAAGLLLCALLTAVGGNVLAAPFITSEAPEKVALTIYPDERARSDARYLRFDGSTGMALVTEWRTVEVDAGETALSFRGVAQGIVPETATLEGLPATLVEQNQDFDLLTPASLIQRSIGAKVKRIRTDAATGQETVEDAVLRSGPNGMVLEIDGRYEALGCGGPAQRLVFDKAPKGLTGEPTLSMRLRVRTAGQYRVKLTYLAVGVLWSANYVAAVQPDGKVDLTGWITLRNLSGTTFTDATTQFVAGDVERSSDTRSTVVYGRPAYRSCWPMGTTTSDLRNRFAPPPPPPPAPAPMADVSAIVVTAHRRSEGMQDVPIAFVAEQSELGDYKLYSLPVATTVASRQTKQVMMLQRSDVSVDVVYGLRLGRPEHFDDDRQSGGGEVSILLRGKNSKARGLGLALPGGQVAVTERTPGGRLILAGEGMLQNTPVDGELDMPIGVTTEIAVTAERMKSRTTRKSRLDEIEVTVTNLRAAPSRFELVQTPFASGMKIRKPSLRPTRKPSGQAWLLPLAPGERRTIRYTVETDLP